MAVRTKEYLKTLFESGDIPSADNFIDLIDSFLDVTQDNFPNPLPAVSAQNLINLPTLNVSSLNVGEFNPLVGVCQYLGVTSFNIVGNLVAVFGQFRRIRLNHVASTSILTVKSATYDSGTGKTTVIVYENISSSTINSCDIALVTPMQSLGSVTRQVIGMTRGADIPVASSLYVGWTDMSFDITGNGVSVTSISERPVGDIIRLYFTGTSCVLVNSATLLLRNGQDFDVAAGDVFEFERIATGWRQIRSYAAAGTLPVGSILYWASSTPPNGFLKFTNTPISRTRYSKLFSIIGTTYGAGDGSTTFNIPDGRGQFSRFFDDAAGIDSGRVLGSLQADDFKSHTHAWSTVLATASSNSNGTATPTTSATNLVFNYNPMAGINAVTGGTETRPKNMALMGIIKYQ